MKFKDKVNLLLVLWLMSLSIVIFLREEKGIVTLDTKKVVNELILNNGDKEAQLTQIDEMSQCLSQIIETYASEHHVMILPQQAAIAGNRDVTQEIRRKMNEKCLNNPKNSNNVRR